MNQEQEAEDKRLLIVAAKTACYTIAVLSALVIMGLTWNTGPTTIEAGLVGIIAALLANAVTREG